jgi:hypothetical protein
MDEDMTELRTSGLWKVSTSRASSAKYLISLFNDKIQAVYEIENVLEFNDENRKYWRKYFEFDYDKNWLSRREELNSAGYYKKKEIAFEAWLNEYDVKYRKFFLVKKTNDLDNIIGQPIEYYGQNPVAYLNC